MNPPTQISPGTASSPGPTISGLTPTFSWNAVSGATGYGLYIKDVTSGTLYSYGPLTGTTYPLASGVLVSGHQYRWNMTSYNASGEGPALTANLLYFQTSGSGISISLTSPNGGENWTAGTTKTVTWSVSNPSQVYYYWIDYSLDAGSSWFQNVVYAFAPATSVSWPISANIASGQARIHIRAFNSTGVMIASATSANNFIISAPGSTIRAKPDASNLAPNSGAPVTFYGGSSTPSAGATITSYVWNFADGGPTIPGATVSHTFSPTATTSYNVQLTVTDSLGQIDTRSLTITATGSALGPNTQQSKSTDPVNLATGNYIYQHSDLKIPGRGIPFEFKRTYNSKDSRFTGSPLGPRWTHSYNILLSNAISYAVVVFGDGHSESYTNAGGVYQAEPGVHSTLQDNGNSTFTLTTKEQVKYAFAVSGAVGRLNSIVDKNGNTVTLNYDDGGGNLAFITDTVGRRIDFLLDGSNRITQIIDPLGRTNQFGYDGNGDLVSATDARGGTTHHTYDSSHQMTSATDPNGNQFVQNTYDDEQRVVKAQQDALGGQTSFAYDFVTRITTVTDALGNKTYHQHDELLRITSITDALGNSEVFEYDSDNNRTKVIDKRGKVTTYSYDAKGNVTSKIDPFINTTAISYDQLNNPTNRTDALGALVNFAYDTKGNLTNTTDALGRRSTISYDGFGQPVAVRDANGNTTTNIFNSQGLLIQTKDPLGNITGFGYDAVGRKIVQTNANNNATFYSYDNNDNVLTITDPLGHSITNVYDANNNRIRFTDTRGFQTVYGYDAKDRLVSIQDALDGITSNVFNKLDRKIKTIDARGGVTQYGYDSVGNLVVVTNATGGVIRYTYDENGNSASITDPLGTVISNAFDSANRLVSMQDALGNTTKTAYDSLGRQTQTIDALNRTNYFSYDALGRLTNFTDAAGNTVKYGYDSVGNRVSVTDPNSHTTTNVFDPLNRLIRTTDPSGGVAEFTYDGVGNLISRKDANGNTTTYLYDPNNRRIKITYPTGAPVIFAYDANGNRTSMTDSLGTTTYNYDAFNRLTSVTDCYGKTVDYGYDQDGNRISITYPGNKTVTYSYDAMNRLKTVIDWLNKTTTYTYDAGGNLLNSVNPNGTAASYGYDAGNRLVALTNSAPNSAIISAYRYTLDGLGNHTRVDQVEQLQTTPVVEEVSYTYDSDNRMVALGAQAQGFDANGNMTSITATDLLTYDFENRLTQTVFVGATNVFQYSGSGSRVSANRSGVVTRYVLDVNSPLTQILAETDAGGIITAYYVYGLGLISRIDAGGDTRYYHFDSRGSTIALTDVAGQITDAYAYDPFGRPLDLIENTDNRFRYLGRHGVFTEDGSFLYIRARYYSTKRGRFITKDPATGNDGDSQSLNRYVYALNNPVRLIDISGLSAQDPGSSQNYGTSSDSSFLHKLLTGEYTDNFASFGDIVVAFGSTDAALKYLQATERMSGTVRRAGKVSGRIGYARSILDELGGWNNLVQSYRNAGSNIQWLFNGATYEDWLNFGTLTTTKTTAIALNGILTETESDKLSTAYSVASGSYSIGTGGNLITGEHVQQAVQGLVNGVDAGMQGYLSGINAAGNWLYQETGF